MSEQFEHDDSLPPETAEQDLMALIKKMQQQLVFLEKKIDILISQSQRIPTGEKPYSKPFRTFDHSHRRPNREYGRPYAGKGFDRGSRFEKHQGEENREFGHKRAYDNPREGDSGGRPHFEKRHAGASRGFHQRKKPFYYGRKDRG